MSTIAVDQITDSSGGNTVTINGVTPTQYNTMGRNRIINGDMRIDQRNAGAAVTIANDTSTYTLDRWRAYENTDGVITVGRDTTAPVGFTNSLKVTVTTADSSLSASQTSIISQSIEGVNIADLAWGTSSAKSITISFWVRSSVTGIFGGCVRNDSTRSYPFTYTVNSANTFEYKTITVTGDTTGTWATGTGTGMRLYFSFGDGGNTTGTAGAWTDTGCSTATGSTNLMATLNATWYITGVQLEVGSVATEFERRPYGTELALCQRYCQVLRNTLGEGKIVPGMAMAFTTTAVQWWPTFYVPMRSAPSLTYNNVAALASFSGNLETASTALSTSNVWEHNVRVNITTSNQVQYNPCKVYLSDGYWVAFTAEL